MLYVGLDCHKRYTTVCALDEEGAVADRARLEHSQAGAFKDYFTTLGKPCRVVLEACLAVDMVVDWLEASPNIDSITLAHPKKTRIIAEAWVKTDELDARILAKLLRADMICKAYLPCKAIRRKRAVIRERMSWVRMRTRIRNQVHRILERQTDLAMPVCKDRFGTKGRAALNKAVLPEPDASQLRRHLAVLDRINEPIKEIEAALKNEAEEDPRVKRLMSIPGIGILLGWLIALEIDDIRRFTRPEKLVSYSGLAPSTHSSGGVTTHGKVIPDCDRWLKYAFIEAAWVAVSCSSYFGRISERLKKKGKLPNTRMIAVAHKLCLIAYAVLREDRDYQETPPKKEPILETPSPVASN